MNHASIIDGVRLCKFKRYTIITMTCHSLEKQLKLSQKQRNRIIVTDGVFSMDGYLRQLDKICDLDRKI